MLYVIFTESVADPVCTDGANAAVTSNGHAARHLALKPQSAVQAFIGKIIKSVHDVGEVGAEWASQMVEHLLDKGKNCETVAVKAACCTALAEFSSKRLNQQEILHLLYHCTSDSRAAVREAAVEALGNMQVRLSHSIHSLSSPSKSDLSTGCHGVIVWVF